MSEGLCIFRCVCFDRTFAELKEFTRAEPLSLEQITARYGCGGSCKLCRPYIERMLQTGETEFREIIQVASE